MTRMSRPASRGSAAVRCTAATMRPSRGASRAAARSDSTLIVSAAVPWASSGAEIVRSAARTTPAGAAFGLFEGSEEMRAQMEED